MRMWKQAALYGLLLAAGAFALQWLDYQRMARIHARGIYDFLLAAGFLALGLWIGARVLGRRAAAPAFDGNPRALAELGISPRRCCGRSRRGIPTSRSRPTCTCRPTP
jgi:hypothetical protein